VLISSAVLTPQPKALLLPSSVPAILSPSARSAPMSKHRIKLKLPIFGEAEAEGIFGVGALVIVVIVILFAMQHWPGW
jgi:hypothetical protein